MIKQLQRLRSLFSRRDLFLYIGLFFMMLIGALVDVIGVGAVPAFVATLAVPEKVMAYPLAAKIFASLGLTSGDEIVIWGGIALIGIFILKNAYLTFVHYAQIRLTEYHRVRLSTRLFAAYMRAPYEFHLSRNSAELLRNVSFETNEIFTGVINPALNTLMGIMMTAGIILLLVFTTPLIAFVGVGVMGISSWAFLKVFKKRLKRYGREAKRERKEGIKAVNQGLGALADARVLGREVSFITFFEESMRRFARADRLRLAIAKSTTPVLETIAVAGLMLIVLVLILSGAESATLVPTLALFGAAIVRLRATISQMVAGISQMQYSRAAIPNVLDDLQELENPAKTTVRPKNVREPTSRDIRLPFERGIVLDGVTYYYPGTSEPALTDIHLKIERGSSVAFVGSTGSGKTTLINVILGLLEPQEGRVEADSIDIFSDLPTWYQKVGYIPQTIFLLDDTIRRNIAFGLSDDQIDDERLWKAIRAAQLDSHVMSLKDGTNSVVGERGVRLSGGQRQRMGLARALYHEPEILIMDEATSALDNQTENLVMKALANLNRDCTFIMVAHRLSTVRECNRLYFLKNGRIEAAGTYEDLTRQHEGFKQMANVV